MSIEPGRILWMELGPRGQFKKRPAIALCRPNAAGNFVVAGGSSSTPAQLGNDEIALPFRLPRHPLTKLSRRTVVDCAWLQEVNVSDVLAIGGQLPPSVLFQIITKVETHYDLSARQPRT